MSAYLDRALESATSHSAHVRERTEGLRAQTTENARHWHALRDEERRRWDRVAAVMVEEGALLPDVWPAADRAQFEQARARFLAAVAAGSPRRLAAVQAATGRQCNA